MPSVAFVVALLALIFAPNASAGLLERDVFGNLFYTHIPEFEDHLSHDVVIEQAPGGYRISDSGADITICPPGQPCSEALCVEGATRREAFCPGPVAGLRVTLGDLHDSVENRTTLELVACGGPGNDLLLGGPGSDDLGGGAGRDELHGGAGGDNLAVDLARQIGLGPGHACAPGPDAERFELLDGGPGRDQIEGGPGDDLVMGGEDDDSLVAYEGDDRIDGGGGRDDLSGLDGADRLQGGEDGDFLFGGPGDDDVDGGPGDDDLGRTIRYDADGLGGDATLATAVEEGDDRLDGGDGRDHLSAGPGPGLFDITDALSLQQPGVVDRRLQSADLNGADTLVGGPGEDLVTYANRDLPVEVSLDGIANDGSPGERDRVDADVDRVFGGARADVLRADPGGALLFGDLGGDLILGGAGPDVLLGGFDDGPDTLAGAAGDDQLSGGPGNDALEGGAGMDALLAGSGDDRAFGGPAVDGLQGGAGSDLLDGGAGEDCLFGFAFPTGTAGCPGSDITTPVVGADGADLLRGGPGGDRLAGGDDEDLADYSDRRAPAVVVLPGAAAVWARSSHADQIALDVEGARGGRGHDLLVGNGGDNVFDGGPGDDQVEGGMGVDRLRGGSGRDLIVARDREPDAISCGTKRDLAVIDGEDELVTALSDLCEIVDGGGGRPARGLVRVRPDGGCGLPVRPPGSGRSFLLLLRATLPPRTLIDSSSCGARIRGAVLRRGAFALRPNQARRRLELRLRGGSPGGCDGGPGPVRRLAVESAGSALTVRGRELSATGGGGAWTTVDGCRGTWVRVQSGRVLVSPGGSRPARTLGPGRTYLAPSRAGDRSGR